MNFHPFSFFQAVSTLTDLLRDNLKKSKIKRFVLPTLGEFLYLIASQVKTNYREQYLKMKRRNMKRCMFRAEHKAIKGNVIMDTV